MTTEAGFSTPLRRVFTPFAILSGLLLLGGCIFVIGQPSAQEQELLAIQDTVGKQMSDLGQKIVSNTYSGAQINDLIAQAQITVNQAIQRISELKIPEKTAKFAEDTKKYLNSANAIFTKLQYLVKDFDKYKQDALKVGEKVAQVANDHLTYIESSLKTFGTQLNNIASGLNEARAQIEKIYNSVK